MKQHYEEKLNMLSAKIANTQKERDQVLANMGRKLKALQLFATIFQTFSVFFNNTSRIHKRK